MGYVKNVLGDGTVHRYTKKKEITEEMATIAPFKGLLYNPKKVEDIYTVVAPPYDVITEEEREVLWDRDPYNVVRLILSKDDKAVGKNRYQKAKEVFNTWMDEDILIRDETPAIYYYQQTYTIRGDAKARTRKGFIALMRLEEFSSGAIYPHERTLAKPKADRLKLIEACNAHFSCIFSLYQDPTGEIDETIRGGRKVSPIIDINDDEGINNKLWRITDSEVLREVTGKMSEKSLLIADGHHRYETALRYRDIMRQKRLNYRGDEGFNFVMMYFSSMDDKGLSALPTHRLIHGIEGFNPRKFISNLTTFFNIEEIRFNGKSEAEKGRLFLNQLQIKKKERKMSTFGIYIKGEETYRLLTLKDIKIMDKWITNGISGELKTLDLTIIHTLIVKGIIGIDEGSQERQEKIDYIKDVEKAIESVKRDKYQMAFILNPPEIEKIKAIAAAGEKMPQKSTFFYPKLLTGLVINPIMPWDNVSL